MNLYKMGWTLVAESWCTGKLFRYYPKIPTCRQAILRSGMFVLSLTSLLVSLLLTGRYSAMGKSRSATCLIAYLMRRHGLTPEDALSRLRETRPMCEPNAGFVAQLQLYHRIGCPSDLDANPEYQRWLYQRDVEISLACGQAPENLRFMDEQGCEGPDHEDADKETELRCRKCRYHTCLRLRYALNHAR